VSATTRTRPGTGAPGESARTTPFEFNDDVAPRLIGDATR
jgi:hypothetical protein